MSALNKQLWLTRVLAILSLVGVFFSHLALTDIAHGEANVATEWLIVQLSAGVVILFIAATLYTLGRVKREVERTA
ncbi:MAG: hypothetical protein HPY76_00560 [Anaerolineae bacterium]|nr:hypothetical protein [Anaerolineae bacterium]